MPSSMLWLEIIRIFLGLLILLALSTLFSIFNRSRMIKVLNIIAIGFALYTLQSIFGAYQAMGNEIPSILGLEVDEFIEAIMFIVFAVAVVKLKSVFENIKFEQELIKSLKKMPW